MLVTNLVLDTARIKAWQTHETLHIVVTAFFNTVTVLGIVQDECDFAKVDQGLHLRTEWTIVQLIKVFFTYIRF